MMDGRKTLLLLVILHYCACAQVKLQSWSQVDSLKNPRNESRTGFAASTQLNQAFLPKMLPRNASSRSGFGIQKGPPDLQFGLSFTVPFVSLSTDKLLSQVSAHRGYDSLWDLASVLKLNIGGVVVAAVVGLMALLVIPALLSGKLGNILNPGGGWAGNGFGGFFPGLLDQLVPGFGLNKPLGYGQTYDPSNYEYNNPYYGSGSHRSESKGKSRALKQGSLRNQTSNFWTNVLRQVRKSASEFETCALYTVCEQGRDFSQRLNKTTRAKQSRRGRESGTTHQGDTDPPVSTVEQIFKAVEGIGGGDVPGIGLMRKAYESGKMGRDCRKYLQKCPLSSIVDNMGEYIFNSN